MQGIIHTYVNKRECLVVCFLIYIWVKFSQRRVSLIAIKIKIFEFKTELNILLGHSTDAFKQNNVDCYIQNRPSKLFCHGSYQVLDYFVSQSFLLIILYYPKNIMISNKKTKQMFYQIS